MTADVTAAVFDVCGPLPTGTTVLEASAGTGKTFTIAALATRYVAEGVAELGELMLVTFGRAATSELRDRVRERLVSTERALRDPAAATSSDPLVAHLAADGDAERERRRRRLTRALAEVDAATITTTHGFCQQMLTTLGVTGDVDRDAVLVPDIADLVDEVTTDVYLRGYAASADRPLSPTEARTIARAAISDHDARLEPTDDADADADPAAPAEPNAAARHRYRFARAVRDELRDRKRERRVLHYDDLLVLLRDALTDPATGAHAVERVRSRYAVVMVDEFQDTDPVQWDVLRTAFHGHRTVVLIGDPKQAIYAFRGADVVTYLAAARDAHTHATLGTNWRSDGPVLDGLAAVLGETALGDPDIVVRPVEAHHTGRRLRGPGSAGAPVRLRQVTRAALGHRGNRPPRVPVVRAAIYADVAADVVRSLGSTEVQDRDTGRWRPLRPGDVAVLARRNADASAIREALTAVGVPAVESGVSSVFATPAARDWLTLLAALSQPGHSGRVAAAALTPFLGWDARQLSEAAEPDRDRLADTVRTWAHTLETRGVAALVEAVSGGPGGGTDDDGLVVRLMRTESGERVLTDVRHIGQALHAAAVAERMGTGALTEWLRRRITEAGEDYTEERSRRLETDAAAVQVVTVHASKGLEFPVVHVPFAWDRYADRSPALLSFHADDGTRVRHVGGKGSPGYEEGRVQHLAEDFGEDLRLAYVALTRASSQVVLWWAPSSNSSSGPLTRLLLGGHGAGEVPPDSVPVPSDDDAAARFAEVAARSGGGLAVETVTDPPVPERWEPPSDQRAELRVARFDRTLDRTWRRTSYSGLTAAAYEAAVYESTAEPGDGVTSEPETTGTTDEPVGERPGSGLPSTGTAGPEGTDPHEGVASLGHGPGGPLEVARGLVSPLSTFPGGAAFGTLVHEVLEHVDTATGDLPSELVRHCREASLVRGLGVDPDALAVGLGPVMATPLGPLAGDRTLADLHPTDRLAELTFELPLAGGDEPARSAATLRAVGDLLRTHLPADDPLAGYADRLDHPLLGTDRLRGYLTGSIDAVLRVRGPGPDDVRYLVADYKTNRLAPAGEPVTAWHYRRDAMVSEMLHAHYPLQLLLYTVGLHRFLRWRQPGYDPDRHLGGGLYLFVRGMVGPRTPVVDGMPCGVFAWRPPTALVTDLSALLDGRLT